MYKLLTYPCNIIIALLVAGSLTLLNYSYFYTLPTQDNILQLLVVILCYAFIFLLLYKARKPVLSDNFLLQNTYKYFLLFSLSGFAMEFILYGIPIMLSGGRDTYSGLPVLHVVFYSAIICSVLFAALYSSTKKLIICFVSAVIISILILSRQMMMLCCMLVLISMTLRYKFSLKSYLYVLVFVVALAIFFGILGDIRQQLAGDYIDNYIIVIGGANEKGATLGSSLYWLWLYIASPMYNFFYNLNSYNDHGNACATFSVVGSCDGSYIYSVLMPNTMSKYLGGQDFFIDLVMPHLNAGTGYSVPARLLGLPGVLLQIGFQFFYYLIGYYITPKKVRAAYIVFYSSLSVFMIFDNLYIRGEFFFSFVLIIIAGWLMPSKDSLKRKDNKPMAVHGVDSNLG